MRLKEGRRHKGCLNFEEFALGRDLGHTRTVLKIWNAKTIACNDASSREKHVIVSRAIRYARCRVASWNGGGIEKYIDTCPVGGHCTGVTDRLAELRRIHVSVDRISTCSSGDFCPRTVPRISWKSTSDLAGYCFILFLKAQDATCTGRIGRETRDWVS